MVRGEVDQRGNSINIRAREIAPMWKVREEYIKGVVLTINPHDTSKDEMSRLHTLCMENSGHCTLYFELQLPEYSRLVRIRSQNVVIEPTPALMKGVNRLFGAENVQLETTE